MTQQKSFQLTKPAVPMLPRHKYALTLLLVALAMPVLATVLALLSTDQDGRQSAVFLLPLMGAYTAPLWIPSYIIMKFGSWYESKLRTRLANILFTISIAMCALDIVLMLVWTIVGLHSQTISN